ncbi:MAG: ATP-dependent DNA helicase RecG [Candidatus Niyogibacteria bacterium]|nr:ATP-dependent DNA helicase RecG [Candidatus Niyogibacteria bacterium]
MHAPLSNYLNLTPHHEKALRYLGIQTVRDLLYFFPIRYKAFGEEKLIADLAEGEEATIQGRVISAKAEKTWKKKINIATTVVSDGSASIRIVWFNQPYMAHILSGNAAHIFSGKIQRDKKGLYIANPRLENKTPFSKEKEIVIDKADKGGALIPFYSETKGITSRWISFALQKIWNAIKHGHITLHDPIPEDIRTRYRLPDLSRALLAIHMPQKHAHIETARKRFAFEEIFFIQLIRQKDRIVRTSFPSFLFEKPDSTLPSFLEALPYELTGAQKRAVDIIFADLKKTSPMARLLEGDVGSGKTAVASAAINAVFAAGKQSAFMAPTEVVARQHYQELQKLFAGKRIRIGLITSSESRKFPSKIRKDQDTHISRNQLLKWISTGEIDVLIGTHALIQDKVKFKHLALAVVDEQHRFGIRQRANLVTDKTTNSPIPHLLSMTATPIPRTLALTMYGDLDLTLLDEMPPGRKQIKTHIVPPEKRDDAYEFMRKEINAGRQAYVVCPRIEEEAKTDNPLFLDMKSVKVEYKKLKKGVFPEFEIGMLHGRMLPKEKEKVMNDFRDGNTRVLVATSVIEVGVNVPNATMIMIEGAERFGLAQLHQLRGRVLRSTHQPYCFIFTDSNSQKTRERLHTLVTAKNGFELAEYDLAFRGAGELAGIKQWGISDVAMEALKNIKMVEAARIEAQTLLKEDLELKKYPLLQERIEKLNQTTIHFE